MTLARARKAPRQPTSNPSNEEGKDANPTVPLISRDFFMRLSLFLIELHREVVLEIRYPVAYKLSGFPPARE